MNKNDIIGTVIACVIFFAIGFIVGWGEKEKQAISVGAAYYNPTNANFEWKGLADANKTN